MKKVKALFLMMAVLAAAGMISWSGYAADQSSKTVNSEMDSTIHISTKYNEYGVALSSTTTNTQVLTTIETENGEENTVTTTTVTVTESSYKNGSLSSDTSTTNSEKKDDEGNVLSTEKYTDTYTYDENGYLQSVEGSGTSESTTYSDKNGEKSGSSEGTIKRTFDVKDGQARLLSHEQEGTTYDKDGKEIGTYDANTTYADWEYLGGQWVHNKEVSTSNSHMTSKSDQTIVRTKTITRDEYGQVTGMSQTATGTYKAYTGINDDETASTVYTLTNYKAEFEFDEERGWYLASEEYDWENIPRTAYDPWTKGTLAMVDGRLALKVDPDDVDGTNFYNMDPSEVTGETQTDEDGNMIFMLNCDDPQTEKKLQLLVGQEINMMWQYYTAANVKGTGGYGWLHLASTSDSRVAHHLQHDSVAKVTQWGGTWDRSQQFVEVDLP